MASNTVLEQEIYNLISNFLGENLVSVSSNTPLIGGDSVLDSMKLVELCLALEDKAALLSFEFDWTSDVAMSKSRSMFRTAGALANEFVRQQQMQAQK